MSLDFYDVNTKFTGIIGCYYTKVKRYFVQITGLMKFIELVYENSKVSLVLINSF